MNIPAFGKAQNEDPYVIPQPGADKTKTALLMFGGLAVILILLGMLVFGGKKPAGQSDLLTVVEQTGYSIGAIDKYSKNLKNTSSKNDISQIQIFLKGNYQTLGALYAKTYDKKKVFKRSPLPDPASITTLEAAVKNDTVDSQLITVLKPKILKIQHGLQQVKPNFTANTSKDTIRTAQSDYQSITDILNK